MKKFDLEKLLEMTGARMRLDLSERLIPHKGELGTGREAVVRDFLKSYLPQRFEVSSGFLFDSSGRVSDQLDIIIANTLAAPRFETAGGKRFYPCESVVAVGQIRSTLTSRGELAKALRNLESAKTLDRSAGGEARDLITGDILNPRGNHRDQIFRFLMVTGKSLAQRTAQEFMLEYVTSTPVEAWPNVTLSLDRYLITFCCDRGVCPNPLDARGIAL